MTEIVTATEKDIPVIHELANAIWWPTYRPILSEEQISFMLENMYSENALAGQMNDGIQFVLCKDENKDVAFAGYSIELQDNPMLRIHKIYVLPSQQGKGTGKQLIQHLTQIARMLELPKVELNVNRANPALGFYQKMGFETVERVDIPYHQFVLNDFVMRYTIT